MIEDAKAGKFDMIITKSISRFARNTLDCLTYVRMLKNLDKKVGVLFDKEGIMTLDSRSETILTIIASIMEEESRTISANVQWGVTKRFSQGIPHIPTTYFLGYDEDENGKLIINPEEAKIIRRIYKELLEGKGASLIAQGLTKDKIKTARGNTSWTSDAILKLIKNEKYCGHALCQKSVTLDPLSHKRVRNKNHKPQYFIRDNHPPIISEAKWNAAQKELERRRMMARDPDGKYKQVYSGKAPFSNLLYCDECGMPITRRRLTSQRNGQTYKFSAWQCTVSSQRAKVDFKCKASYIWEEVLEQAYNQMLHRMTHEIEKIKAEAEEAIRLVDLTEEEQTRLSELEEITDRIEEQISELSMRQSVTNDPIYDATLRNLIYELQIYQQEYESLMKSQDESKYMRSNLEILTKHLKEIEDFETFDGNIFNDIIERGILKENYKIEFLFKCGIKRTAHGWKRGILPPDTLSSLSSDIDHL